MFLERSLNDPPPPHFKHLSLLPPPHPPPLPPSKNFDHTLFTAAPLSSGFWLLQECYHVTHHQWILARSILTVTVALVAFCNSPHSSIWKSLWNAYNNYNCKGRLLFHVSDTFKYIIKCHPPSLPQLFCTFKHIFVTHPAKISVFP